MLRRSQAREIDQARLVCAVGNSHGSFALNFMRCFDAEAPCFEQVARHDADPEVRARSASFLSLIHI